MRHWRIVDEWYKIISKKMPDMPEDDRIRLAILLYDEADYITLMGVRKPGGLFEKLNIPLPPKEYHTAKFHYPKLFE